MEVRASSLISTMARALPGPSSLSGSSQTRACPSAPSSMGETTPAMPSLSVQCQELDQSVFGPPVDTLCWGTSTSAFGDTGTRMGRSRWTCHVGALQSWRRVAMLWRASSTVCGQLISQVHYAPNCHPFCSPLCLKSSLDFAVYGLHLRFNDHCVACQANLQRSLCAISTPPAWSKHGTSSMHRLCKC
jgi:hypothetical protein